jgi:hypothetical protein
MLKKYMCTKKIEHYIKEKKEKKHYYINIKTLNFYYLDASYCFGDVVVAAVVVVVDRYCYSHCYT